jgi:hypothetical protein
MILKGITVPTTAVNALQGTNAQPFKLFLHKNIR